MVCDRLICDLGTGRADLGLPLNRPLSSSNLEADAEILDAPLVLALSSKSSLIRLVG